MWWGWRLPGTGVPEISKIRLVQLLVTKNKAETQQGKAKSPSSHSKRLRAGTELRKCVVGGVTRGWASVSGMEQAEAGCTPLEEGALPTHRKAGNEQQELQGDWIPALD